MDTLESHKARRPSKANAQESRKSWVQIPADPPITPSGYLRGDTERGFAKDFYPAFGISHLRDKSLGKAFGKLDFSKPLGLRRFERFFEVPCRKTVKPPNCQKEFSNIFWCKYTPILSWYIFTPTTKKYKYNLLIINLLLTKQKRVDNILMVINNELKN